METVKHFKVTSKCQTKEVSVCHVLKPVQIPIHCVMATCWRDKEIVKLQDSGKRTSEMVPNGHVNLVGTMILVLPIFQLVELIMKEISRSKHV